MSELVLYGCPKACSLVSHIALEMTQAPFEYRFVNMFSREHLKESYLAISPRGKVPLLVMGDQKLNENIAILNWLAEHFTDSTLLPAPASASWFGALSDLSWFASGIHPCMTRMLLPERFVRDKDSQAALRASALKALGAEFALIDRHLAERRWWLDAWSALDAYLFWIWARSGEGQIDLSTYSNYARHAQEMLSLQQVQRVLERERGYLPCYEQLDNIC